MTQRELAAKAELDVKQVQSYERKGGRNPQKATRLRLLKALGLLDGHDGTSARSGRSGRSDMPAVLALALSRGGVLAVWTGDDGELAAIAETPNHDLVTIRTRVAPMTPTMCAACMKPRTASPPVGPERDGRRHSAVPASPRPGKLLTWQFSPRGVTVLTGPRRETGDRSILCSEVTPPDFTQKPRGFSWNSPTLGGSFGGDFGRSWGVTFGSGSVDIPPSVGESSGAPHRRQPDSAAGSRHKCSAAVTSRRPTALPPARAGDHRPTIRARWQAGPPVGRLRGVSAALDLPHRRGCKSGRGAAPRGRRGGRRPRAGRERHPEWADRDRNPTAARARFLTQRGPTSFRVPPLAPGHGAVVGRGRGDRVHSEPRPRRHRRGGGGLGRGGLGRGGHRRASGAIQAPAAAAAMSAAKSPAKKMGRPPDRIRLLGTTITGTCGSRSRTARAATRGAWT